jgi:hypothetical protein
MANTPHQEAANQADAAVESVVDQINRQQNKATDGQPPNPYALSEIQMPAATEHLIERNRMSSEDQQLVIQITILLIAGLALVWLVRRIARAGAPVKKAIVLSVAWAAAVAILAVLMADNDTVGKFIFAALAPPPIAAVLLIAWRWASSAPQPK